MHKNVEYHSCGEQDKMCLTMIRDTEEHSITENTELTNSQL